MEDRRDSHDAHPTLPEAVFQPHEASAHPDDPIDGVTRLADLEGAEDQDAIDDRRDSRRSPPLLPRFLQDQGAWKRWRWVPYRVRRFLIAAAIWSEGPIVPREHRIDPWFPAVQHAPLLAIDKCLRQKSWRRWVFVAYCAIWLLTFALVLRSGRAATEIEGWGSPLQIGCGTSYWAPGNRCGLDGNDCRPFNGSGFAFRCPASCAGYQTLNYRAVGDQEIVYRPLVIGGPRFDEGGRSKTAVYRGDSYLCGSAIHAGFISNTKGGCGLVRLIGSHQGFAGSVQNGISSIAFDSHFPLSFTFDDGIECEAKDVRWLLLVVSLVFTIIFSLFTSNPAVFFFTIFTAAFWHVGMASDPPNHTSLADLFSRICGRYTSAIFAAWVIYDKMGVRHVLLGLSAQVEKTVLWLGACWLGALSNYTFSWVPIQRLTPQDLAQQSGAYWALAGIILLIIVIAAGQGWYMRQEGSLVSYLKLYLIIATGLIVCGLLPDLKLRIHHYILSLIFLPGTSMQTRLSLLYQGLLVGLFINGIARWDWSPLLETPYAVSGRSNTDSPLPIIHAPSIQTGANMSSIAFTWDASPPGLRYDGISVLVNDVERYRAYFFDPDKDAADGLVWTRPAERAAVNEYFRFAYMSGSQSADYTRAGIWTKDGEWIDMPPGPSLFWHRRRRGWNKEESVIQLH